MAGKPQPVANGLRTDHPVPGLPFVDDAVLPLEDPQAVEALGRGAGHGRWGRCDMARDTGEWQAFATDPQRPDLAWQVRHHPEHGTCVLLFRNRDAARTHTSWWNERPLLHRSGGYWWDGATWYRPGQVWDGPSEAFERHPVPAAVTVTAADALDEAADPQRGALLALEGFDPDTPYDRSWPDDLALWAEDRTARRAPRPLSACVVRLSAPELSADQLLTAAELAGIGGIVPSTLRAYISRGEGEVPLPQAVVGGRPLWSRPVAADWAEARRRSPENVAAALADPASQLNLGEAAVYDRYAQAFRRQLWEDPDRRKRWARVHRTEASVGQTADALALTVAADLDHIIPADALAAAVRGALLDELAVCKDLFAGGSDPGRYPIGVDVARMLDWLVRHYPRQAQTVINDTVREAENRLEIPRKATEDSLRSALRHDGALPPAALADFLERVLSEQPPRH